MSSYDQARMPLTMDNVQGWARENFLAVFSALPHINTLIFGDNDDDLTYDRKIGRNLDRSEHKKLLLVGRYSPGPDVEDAEILAHIHEGESEIAFFMSEQLDDGRFELHVVKNTSAIAFYPPLSDVGNDTENNKSIQRVEALISYYFLAAGHLKEIFRSKRFEKLFTRGFQDACYWIANGGEAPLRTPLDSLQLLDGGARSDTATMIESNMDIIEVRVPSVPKRKAERDTQHVEPRTKRPALGELSSNIHRSSSATVFQTPRQKNSYTQLQAQIESLESEKNNLKEDLVLQQYAYRSLKKDCDEVKEQLAELEAEEKATSTRYVECKKELQIWKRRANAAEAALSENKVELLAIKAGMRTIGDIVKGCESHQ